MDFFARVKVLISEQLGAEEGEMTKDTSFEELNADSLDIVELVMAIEEEFKLEISDEEVEKIKTVGDVVRYIETHV
ncbi:MAG: acyl carrier protein [Dethiobacter sp.]|mgnify:CR=1 FL=1|jgi:acyl carrier protein|nr:acyl carrier protein [Dethiobacter sp.]MBS3899776.1 acyl carrier protein [Dethiobacter sp.]MBS3982431.1 acyl carrier protein [Dethiobacter sp.]MCL4463184.1 acyl carrier protein [Bacillota bacterium]MCL5994295.1 acyl carrier protein [Bacillota bacterium]